VDKVFPARDTPDNARFPGSFRVKQDTLDPARANADVLLWQAPARIAIAMFLGLFELLFQQLDILGGSDLWVAITLVGYVIAIRLLSRRMRETGTAGNLMVAATVFADLAFIFGSTIASSPVAYYARILVLSFFVLHSVESYFGRTHATMTLLAVVVGYLVAVRLGALVRGTPQDPIEEIWSISLFTTAALLLIVQFGNIQRRLEHIVELFEWAEEGDFSRAYDVNTNTNPESITRVGRAYNRVRLQLASMVLTDPLTGCLNRRGLDQVLAREIARAGRTGQQISLIAVDLDHFKKVNDTYGHITGDVVLRELGMLLGQAARSGDMVARTGGEEFSILLPQTGPEGAYRMAVRIWETVRNHAFMVNGTRLKLTVSVGVVTSPGVGGDAVAASLKERADVTLYAAKRGGRDQVREWDDAFATSLTPTHDVPLVSNSRS
jgi:diguanylate cyclase (GGDEF)-like protein